MQTPLMTREICYMGGAAVVNVSREGTGTRLVQSNDTYTIALIRSWDTTLWGV